MVKLMVEQMRGGIRPLQNCRGNEFVGEGMCGGTNDCLYKTHNCTDFIGPRAFARRRIAPFIAAFVSGSIFLNML